MVSSFWYSLKALLLLSADFIGYACSTLQWASTYFLIYDKEFSDTYRKLLIKMLFALPVGKDDLQFTL